MLRKSSLFLVGLLVGLLPWGAGAEEAYALAPDVPAAVAPEDATVGAVTVVGCVRLQGTQQMSRAKPYLLSAAIEKAGGLAKWANGRKVEVIRRGVGGQKEKIVADVIAILKEGRQENDLELQAGDLVKVPERYFNL